MLIVPRFMPAHRWCRGQRENTGSVGRMRQRAVSRAVADRKGAFYVKIPLVAGQRGAPYDAPLFAGPYLPDHSSRRRWDFRTARERRNVF
jgi:hypothetical protein